MKWRKLTSVLLAACVAGSLMLPVTASAAEEEKTFAGLEGYGSPVITDVFDRVSEHTHGSGIVELPDGELLAVWFQGDGERKANYGRIMASRLPVGAEEWSEPFVIADTPGMPDCNPTVYVDENDRLWLFWYPVLAHKWESSQPKFKYAEKGHYESANGFTQQPDWDWQEIMYPTPGDDFVGQATSVDAQGVAQYRIKGDTIKYLSEDQFNQWESKDDPRAYVKVGDRYITDSFVTSLYNGYMDMTDYVAECGLYDEGTTAALQQLLKETAESCAAVASGYTNNWKEWNPTFRRLGWQTKNKPMEIQYQGKTRLLLPLYADQFAASIMAYSDDNGKSWSYSDPIASMGGIQAATVQKEDGTLRSYFRNAEPNAYLVYHESKDGGETWTFGGIETQLRHVGGFDMIKLDNGDWVMAITESITDATENQDNRSRLNIAVSQDEGKTWQVTPLQEDMTGRNSYHYPAITLREDGSILVSYSYDDRDGTNNIRVAEFSAPEQSSGGGSVSKFYDVTTKQTSGGTVSVSSSRAAAGAPVVVTVVPEQGYTVASLTVTSASGKDITVQELSGGKYRFTMPDASVTVQAQFSGQAGTGLPFGDVSASDWYYEAVRYVWEQGIMTGVEENAFQPSGLLSRGMLAQILYALEGKPQVNQQQFQDTKGTWYDSAANWAAASGVMSGYGNGSFGGEDSITREQLAVALRAYAQYKKQDTSAQGSLNGFVDSGSASAWAVDALEWAVSQGLLSGKDGGRLDPSGSAQRCEVAQVMMTFLEK